MSEPVTEIVQIPLAPGVDLSTGEAKRTWDETLKTITSQRGCKSLYWGHQVENPHMVHMAVDWDNIQAHKTFESLPVYEPFLESLRTLLDAAPTLFHITLPQSTPFSTPGSAPVTECLNLYFASTFDPVAFSANWAQFRSLGLETAKEAQGLAGAWSVEQLRHHGVWNEDEHGDEGPTFAGFIGWPSVEAHMQFRDSDDFSKVAGYLREGPKAIKMYHVEFKKYM